MNILRRCGIKAADSGGRNYGCQVRWSEIEVMYGNGRSTLADFPNDIYALGPSKSRVDCGHFLLRTLSSAAISKFATVSTKKLRKLVQMATRNITQTGLFCRVRCGGVN